MGKFMRVVLALVAMAVILPACSSKKETASHSKKLDPFAGVGSPHYKGSGAVPTGGGRYHVGKPYQVAGRWFTPKEQPGYDKKGQSSWYGEAFHRRKTSNGEWFDMNRLTAAHATLPLPSYAKVTNLANGKSVVVRINDRGPFVDTRVIDVSKKTADILGYKAQGIGEVRVQYIGLAPLDDKGAHLAAMNEGLARGNSIRQLASLSENGNFASATRVAVSSPAQRVVATTETAPADLAVAQGEESYPASSSRAGQYFIAVGSFSNPANATKITEDLTAVGKIQVAELSNQRGRYYRLRLGPLKTAEAANVALSEVHNYGLTDAHVIEAQVEQAALQ